MEHAKIVAVEVDGCLVTNKWPEIGEPIEEVISRYRLERSHGTRFILWSCRSGHRLDEAVAWCSDHGISFDAINEPLPELLAAFAGNPRKVFADEYWDDRAVCMPRSCMDSELRHAIYRDIDKEYNLEDIRSRLFEMDDEQLHGRTRDELCEDEQFLAAVNARWEKSRGWCDGIWDTTWELCDMAIGEVLGDSVNS